MKKIIAVLAIAVGACVSSQAQGTVAIYNIGAANGVKTNSAVGVYAGGSGANGVTGLTSASGTFYYALLTSAYDGSAPTSLTSPDWSVATTATNYLVAGGIRGAGGNNGTAITGWAGDTTMFITLVGWSANLGTTWAQVSAELASGSWASADGFFGASAIAYMKSATSPAPATSIFGGTGLPAGITLYAVPEPGTMALAALGGASLLLFRRRK